MYSERIPCSKLQGRASEYKKEFLTLRFPVASYRESSMLRGKGLGQGAGRGKGRGMGSGQGRGRGRMGGNKPGAGPAGYCICPKCGEKIEHQPGVPCYSVQCPKCSTTMMRE